MKLINLVQMNDWSIKTFLIFILSFQLLFWGAISLDLIGINIFFLRQIVCVIYLFFVPGIITLRVLKYHKLTGIENLLFTVGLSISFLMLTGLLMDILFPLIGISKPISIIPLVVTISLLIFVLCILCFIRDRDFSDPDYIDLKEILSPPSLFLYLIPILTIIGTYLVNFYNVNFLLMFVIILISLFVAIVSFDLIPNRLYSLALFSASISLLLHNSLISMYISGWDIQFEYFIANRVISNFFWDPNLPSDVNGVLSITILAPVCSILSGISLTWVFKIIYPIIYSLTPLGLYIIIKKQTTQKIAFISGFFFISFFGFYTEMLDLARQQIAELFFILLIILIVQDRNDASNHSLMVVFSLSMIVSHYGLSYLVSFSLLGCLLLLFIYRRYSNKLSKNKISILLTTLFTIALIAWYFYVSNSSGIETVIYILKNMISQFTSDLLPSQKSEGIYLITNKTNFVFHEVTKYIHLFTQFCISFGLLLALRDLILNKNSKINREYLSLSISFIIYLIAAIIVPGFAISLNTTRIYQISLILLSPFCIIGMKALINSPRKLLNFDLNNDTNLPKKFLSIFFSLFLLLNSGWVYEVVNEFPTSISLSKNADYPMFNQQEVVAKEWLYTMIINSNSSNFHIYSDYYRKQLFVDRFGYSNITLISEYSTQNSNNSYIYLSRYNILEKKVLVLFYNGLKVIPKYVDYSDIVKDKSLFYSNGGSDIYT